MQIDPDTIQSIYASILYKNIDSFADSLKFERNFNNELGSLS